MNFLRYLLCVAWVRRLVCWVRGACSSFLPLSLHLHFSLSSPYIFFSFRAFLASLLSYPSSVSCVRVHYSNNSNKYVMEQDTFFQTATFEDILDDLSWYLAFWVFERHADQIVASSSTYPLKNLSLSREYAFKLNKPTGSTRISSVNKIQTNFPRCHSANSPNSFSIIVPCYGSTVEVMRRSLRIF